jgi:hypothetical protein
VLPVFGVAGLGPVGFPCCWFRLLLVSGVAGFRVLLVSGVAGFGCCWLSGAVFGHRRFSGTAGFRALLAFGHWRFSALPG